MTDNDRRGFTLIEVIAVLIIIGIITAVAVSRMSIQGDLTAQTDIVKTHLRFAQLKALTDDTATWGISFTGSSYTLLRNNSAASLMLPSEDSNSHTFPSGVTSPNQAVNFDSWGNPSGGTASIPISQGGSSATITITGNTGHITP